MKDFSEIPIFTEANAIPGANSWNMLARLLRFIKSPDGSISLEVDPADGAGADDRQAWRRRGFHRVGAVRANSGHTLRPCDWEGAL